MRRSPPLVLCLVPLLLSAELFAADSRPERDRPKGEIAKYTFDKSRIFPGTVR